MASWDDPSDPQYWSWSSGAMRRDREFEGWPTPSLAPRRETDMGKETVERVARAIHDNWQGTGRGPAHRTWEETCDKLPGQANSFRSYATAAVEAVILEPVAWRWRFVGEDDDHWMVRRTKPPAWVEPGLQVEIQPLYALLEK